MSHDLTDAEACTLYLSVGWEDPYNNDWPDPEIADDVRQMLAAPTDQDAYRLALSFRYGSDDLRNDVSALRRNFRDNVHKPSATPNVTEAVRELRETPDDVLEAECVRRGWEVTRG